MDVLPACMCVPHAHFWSEEGVGSPGIGVRDGYKPLCEYWEVNLGPLQVQVLQTALQPLKFPFFMTHFCTSLQMSAVSCLQGLDGWGRWRPSV